MLAGQAQKEFFVNEALARADMLLQAAVTGEADAPPAEPANGECWLVGDAPSGAWTGYAGSLACFQSGAWRFALPSAGMRVHDRQTGQSLLYSDGWQRPATPATPTGGTTDSEARDTITTLIEALKTAGLFAAQ